MLDLFIAFFGIFCGIILAKIAKEELVEGKKYFHIFKRVAFLALSFLVLYNFLSNDNILYSLLFLIVSTVMFTIQIKKLSLTTELLTYIIFIIPYFFLQQQLLLSSLLFLYGLPTGTLWQMTRI
jgi:hypothetical protein